MPDRIASPTVEGSERKPLFQRAWFAILGGAAFAVVMIFADQFGYAGDAEWSMLFVIGLGLSTALFWSKRTRPWFWPSIALLITAHIFLLIRWKWDVVPAPGAINLKGAIGLDVGLNSLWLFWMGWLFDPREKPRTSASKTVEIVLYGMAVSIIAIVAFLSWAVQRKHEQKLALAQVVVKRSTSVPLEDLTWCITPDVKELRAWENTQEPRSKHIYDFVYDVGTTITDRGQFRIVTITTLRGKPLNNREATRLDRCL